MPHQKYFTWYPEWQGDLHTDKIAASTAGQLNWQLSGSNWISRKFRTMCSWISPLKRVGWSKATASNSSWCLCQKPAWERWAVSSFLVGSCGFFILVPLSPHKPNPSVAVAKLIESVPGEGSLDWAPGSPVSSYIFEVKATTIVTTEELVDNGSV